MRLAILGLTLVLSVLSVAPLEAQEGANIPRIGYLNPSGAAPNPVRQSFLIAVERMALVGLRGDRGMIIRRERR